MQDFELKGYIFESEKEQLRTERRVRVAVIQNGIVLPTTAPVEDQRHAIYERVGTMVEAASQAGANIVCFQEAWSELERRSVPCASTKDTFGGSDAFCLLHQGTTAMD